MSFFNNEKHFLHQFLSFAEDTKIDGDNGFIDLLKQLGVKSFGETWETDHSTISWNKIENHHQFFFDFEENELKLSDWLLKSNLSDSEYLYTYIGYDDPVIKIKTSDFIKNWEEFYIASVEGLILISTDGKYVLEFTDDWKYHLNSNFEIKPDSKIF